jgi:hypothetical protein
MQKEIKALLNKDVSIWARTKDKSLIVLFSGKLLESNSMKDGFVVNNSVQGTTFSFALHQIIDIEDSNLTLKFVMGN